MLFNVPFIPDEDYIAFLNERSRFFRSCHFSLYSAQVPDSRHRVQLLETERLIDSLKTLDVPRKLLLINSRAHNPSNYLDTSHLRAVVRTLEKLLEAEVIDGLVFSDLYYLQAISDAAGDVASGIEAVPSVNCMLDSFDKILAVLELIGDTRFRTPTAIVPDRSLNRRLESLQDISERMHGKHPDIKLELLANEGCLYQCPYKLAHDCLISMAHVGKAYDGWRIHQELGCMRYLQKNTSRLFKSPFIRPEDIDCYKPFADSLKICGRTLGKDFLMRVIDAYIERKFSGNFIELMDAMVWLARWTYIPNEELPVDFFHTVVTCSKDCTSCSYCEKILKRIGKQQVRLI
jgi:hypothetical protein